VCLALEAESYCTVPGARTDSLALCEGWFETRVIIRILEYNLLFSFQLLEEENVPSTTIREHNGTGRLPL
jgi:hypothetical protein